MLKNNIDIIERFFQLDLNEEELQSFEERLKIDPEFNYQVEQYELAQKTAYELFLPGYEGVLAEQKAAMKKTSPTVQEKKRPFVVRMLSRKILGLAASFALMLAVAYFLMPKQSMNLQQAQLSAQNIAYQSINLDALNNTGTRSTAIEKINPIMEAYQKNEFDQVVALTDTYVNQADILLLRGLAFAQSDQDSQAIDSFNALLSLPSGQKDTALWWLTSIYLDQNNPEKAKIYLNQIIAGKYPSAKKAAEVLKQI